MRGYTWNEKLLLKSTLGGWITVILWLLIGGLMLLIREELSRVRTEKVYLIEWMLHGVGFAYTV